MAVLAHRENHGWRLYQASFSALRCTLQYERRKHICTGVSCKSWCICISANPALEPGLAIFSKGGWTTFAGERQVARCKFPTLTFFFFTVAMKPFGTELVIGLLAIGLNYGATFKLPATSLLKDPVQTLSTTVPVLFVGHILLVLFAHILRGTTNKALVSTLNKCLYSSWTEPFITEISWIQYIGHSHSNWCVACFNSIVWCTLDRVMSPACIHM